MNLIQELNKIIIGIHGVPIWSDKSILDAKIAKIGFPLLFYKINRAFKTFPYIYFAGQNFDEITAKSLQEHHENTAI